MKMAYMHKCLVDTKEVEIFEKERKWGIPVIYENE